MNRLQQILLGLFVVQLILVGVIYMPRGDIAKNEPLLAGFKAEEVTKIGIDDYDKNHIDLSKEGSDWKMVLSDGSLYPVQTENIKTVLDALAGIKTNRMVSRTETSQKQLKVSPEDFVRKVTIENQGGTKTVLYIGSQPGAKTTHVRLDGKNEVYLASLDSSDFGASANVWVDTAYLSLTPEDVISISVKNAGGQLSFTKDTSGKWALKEIEGKPLDSKKVENLVSRITNLRMTTPLSKKNETTYQMDKPLAEVNVSLKGKDGQKSLTLAVGVKDEAKNFYVIKTSTSDYYVRTDGYFVEEFVKNKAADYIEVPPTPTPKPEG